MGFSVAAAPEANFCGAWEAAAPKLARPPTAPSKRPATSHVPQDNEVLLKPPRPMTAGRRIGNRPQDMKAESDQYQRALAQILAVNTEVGPSSYDAQTSYKRCTIPAPPRCSFSSSSRLSILSDKEVTEMNETQLREVPALQLQGLQPNRARPLSARIAHRPGRGHWLDGMATGTTIPGVYNRFLSLIPGVAAYDIGSAKEAITVHSPRCSFGTASRFPGGSRVAGPPPRHATRSIPLPTFEVKGSPQKLQHRRKPHRSAKPMISVESV